jgi:preprotein translocase subunit SecG
MLSFLREQGFENGNAQKSAGGASRPDAPAPQDGQGQEYLTVAAKSKNVRRSTIMVVIIFCVGLVGLWLMIRKSKPQAASGAPAESEETQIEMAIARLTGASTEMFSGMDQIVEKFYEFSDVLQVKVNELVKNPFELEMFLSNLMKKMDVEESTVEVDPELIIQQQLQQKAKKLQLASIMQSDQGTCCMINNKILYEEDAIDGFGVLQISDSFVKLRWIGQDDSESLPSNALEIVLKLSE